MFDAIHAPTELDRPVGQLAGEALDAIFDDDLEASVIEIHRTIERLSAERARRIAEVDRREIHRRLLHPSTASWLADRCRLSWSQERGLVATANTLSEIPLTAACYANGDIDSAQVRSLVAAHDAHPETYARDEETLLDDANHSFSLRRLHVSPAFSGMARIDGDADP